LEVVSKMDARDRFDSWELKQSLEGILGRGSEQARRERRERRDAVARRFCRIGSKVVIGAAALAGIGFGGAAAFNYVSEHVSQHVSERVGAGLAMSTSIAATVPHVTQAVPIWNGWGDPCHNERYYYADNGACVLKAAGGSAIPFPEGAKEAAPAAVSASAPISASSAVSTSAPASVSPAVSTLASESAQTPTQAVDPYDLFSVGFSRATLYDGSHDGVVRRINKLTSNDGRLFLAWVHDGINAVEVEYVGVGYSEMFKADEAVIDSIIAASNGYRSESIEMSGADFKLLLDKNSSSARDFAEVITKYCSGAGDTAGIEHYLDIAQLVNFVPNNGDHPLLNVITQEGVYTCYAKGNESMQTLMDLAGVPK
jgi:hypothetical protein